MAHSTSFKIETMATITLEVPDQEVPFIEGLVQRFSFPAKIQKTEFDSDTVEDEDTDEEVIANIKEGVRQMRLVEQGKMKSRPAREFLKEL